jgi:hypothetical protein
MKIKTISVVLMSLVSVLAFMSQATAACSPPCGANQICVGGGCLPVRDVPPANASTIDAKTCSASGDNVICELKFSIVMIPKKAFEALRGAESQTTK